MPRRRIGFGRTAYDDVGYRNVEIVGADGKRSHVTRQIEDKEAAIVRRIFQLCADGVGQTRIAKQLNAERAIAPRAQQGRPRAWAPSTVHEILFRELYRGVITWNQTRKRNRWGQQQQAGRPAGEWIRCPHRTCKSCLMTCGRRPIVGWMRRGPSMTA